MKLDRTKCLIVGYGSIGARHERILRDCGAETAVVSRHLAHSSFFRVFSLLEDGLNMFAPEYVVIANNTSEHIETLNLLSSLKFSGKCLVEKPLSDKAVSEYISYGFTINVGYCMRFHPLLERTLDILKEKKQISIHAYVGQYLPVWRPDTDYRLCYSAHKSLGGGVLRDLSHEFDYIMMLSGAWKKVVGLGGHFSELEIDSDDTYGVLFQTELCPVVLCQVNYLDRNVRRDCIIQYDGGSIHIDFVNNCLVHNGISETFEISRDKLLSVMHQAVLSNSSLPLCSLEEAVVVMDFIAAAEDSVMKRSWICREKR